MELEVGMYVKTKKGYIYKLSRYEEDNNRWISSEENDWYPVYESLVTKASHNIMDLIKVGDYVNGFYVEDVKETFVNVATGSNYFQSPSIYEEDIKSIVTKEQFESMQYVID